MMSTGLLRKCGLCTLTATSRSFCLMIILILKLNVSVNASTCVNHTSIPAAKVSCMLSGGVFTTETLNIDGLNNDAESYACTSCEGIGYIDKSINETQRSRIGFGRECLHFSSSEEARDYCCNVLGRGSCQFGHETVNGCGTYTCSECDTPDGGRICPNPECSIEDTQCGLDPLVLTAIIVGSLFLVGCCIAIILLACGFCAKKKDLPQAEFRQEEYVHYRPNENINLM